MNPSTQTPVDIEHLRTWIGRSEEDDDLIDARHAHLMAATIGVDPQTLAQTNTLPPLWHWLYFLSAVPETKVGPDGHPQRGGFLPPVPLSNRMWAGGRVHFGGPIKLGTIAHKKSTILDVRHKQGRAGDLVFVTVQHEVSTDGQLCLREEHDIVYRNATPAGGAPAAAADAPSPAGTHTRAFTPSSLTLFRYSALTFNGHRIHYDADYCRQQEGYSAPVIHGPLNATLLAGFAAEIAGRPLLEFSYRGQAPATLGQTLTLHADINGSDVSLSTRFSDGRICMSAQARVQDPHS